MSNKIDDFFARLAQVAPKARESFEVKNRSLEKIYLNFSGNFGRYQVFPINDVVTDFPFVTLFDTKEICIPRKNIAPDGTETTYSAWIKILPKNAYMMRDMNGRIVSSLTSQDEALLDQAASTFNLLYSELDAKNNRNETTSSLVRRRNYTIFYAMCLNKWDPNESRNPSRQNFCGLFVATAKSFTNVIEDSIQETTIMRGGDNTWVTDVYNRNFTGRNGFLMFSVGVKKDGSAGFSITASHGVGNESLKSISVNQEDAEMMQSTVADFLGWQAAKDDQNPPQQKRLFNAKLIREAIEYMSAQIASIRMAKANGIDLKEAVERTNAEVLAKQVPTNNQGVQTNDPMLANMSNPQQAPNVNMDKIIENNTDPYATAPVFHADPVTGAPVNPDVMQQAVPAGGAPFTPGSNFGGGFPGFGQQNGEKKDDLPF